MMLGLRTTVYKVADLTHAKAWYSKAFEAAPYFDEPFYVGYNISGYELGLVPDERTNAANGEGGVVTYWGVRDVESSYARLIQLGATEHEQPHNVGGEIKLGSVNDPWGNIIGIIFNPEFKLEK